MALLGQGAEGGPAAPQEIVERANSLYWDSGASVNRLAQDLDLSKGALYELIAPFPSGISCPKGDGELGFANRTARDRGFVSCPSCGLEDEVDRVMDRLEREGQTPETEFEEKLPVTGTDALSVRGLLVGTAFLGAAAGFVLAGLLKRR